MTDFKITFQDDELSCGDYEKMSLISKIMCRNFLPQFKNKDGIISLSNFKQSLLPRKHISHYGLSISIVGISYSISSILFYKNRLNLSK